MQPGSPYRAAGGLSHPLAPPLGWTRPAALALTLLAALIPALCTYDLLEDHTCRGEPTPHPEGAFLVALFCGALLFVGFALQRHFTQRAGRIFVRSHAGGYAIAGATLLPIVVLGFLAAVLAVYIDVSYTFRIC